MDAAHVSAIISASAGIAGVILGNSFVAIKEALVNRKKDKRDSAYLTILVVSHLDRFANGCMNVAYDDGTAYGSPAGSDGVSYVTTVAAPEFLPLDINVEWKVLPKNLMYEILQIPDKREHIERWLADEGLYDPPDHIQFFWARRRDYAALGLHVSDVARKLRKHAGMPIEECPPGGWDRDAGLREVIDKVDGQRAAFEKRMAEAGSFSPAR